MTDSTLMENDSINNHIDDHVDQEIQECFSVDSLHSIAEHANYKFVLMFFAYVNFREKCRFDPIRCTIL